MKPDRPLLILPASAAPQKRAPKSARPTKIHLPTRGRQLKRLTPSFTALQSPLASKTTSVRVSTAATLPEEVIVLESVGAVSDLLNAARKIVGLEWLGEVEEDDIPPDDDFFVDKAG